MQEDRFRKSCMTRSHNRAKMRLLIKDHKKVRKGYLPPTRPKVDDSDSMGTPLSNHLGEYAEAIADSIEEPSEVASSKEMLFKICDLNNKIKDILNSHKIVCIAFDVVSLYPSLNAREMSKVINN